MSPLMTILLTSVATIITVVVGGMIVHSKTRAETKKFAAEAEDLASQSEARVYDRIKGEVMLAVARADKADERALRAEVWADKLQGRVYALYDLVDRHISWDRMVVDILRTNNIEIPDPPSLKLPNE